MSFILLFMIISRIAWMQLRQYNIEISTTELVTAHIHKDNGHYTNCTNFDLKKPALDPRLYGYWYSYGLSVQNYVFCQLLNYSASDLKQWQIGTLLVTIVSAVWLTRFLTSSWLVSLLVGATLLSRGSLLARLGDISSSHYVTLFIMVWLTCSAHFLRTGSLITYTVASFALIISSLFDSICQVLFLAIPIFILTHYLTYRKTFNSPPTSTIKADRVQAPDPMLDQIHQGLNTKKPATLRQIHKGRFKRGGLLKPMNHAFSVWIYYNHRWIKLILFNMLLFLVTYLLQRAIYNNLNLPKTDVEFSLLNSSINLEFLFSWITTLLNPVDLHYLACLLVIALCCIHSFYFGLFSLSECSWILSIAGMLLVAASFLKSATLAAKFHLYSQEHLIAPLIQLATSSKILIWLEPIILTLGIICFYQLSRVLQLRYKNPFKAD